MRKALGKCYASQRARALRKKAAVRGGAGLPHQTAGDYFSWRHLSILRIFLRNIFFRKPEMLEKNWKFRDRHNR